MKHSFNDLKRLIHLGSRGFIISLIGSFFASLSIFGISVIAGKVSETSLLQVQNNLFDSAPFITYGIITALLLPLILVFQSLNLYGGQTAEKSLTTRVFHKIINRKDFINDHTSTTMNLLTVDVGALNNFYFQGSNNHIILPLIMGIAALIWCFAIDWIFGFIALGCGLLSLLISNRYTNSIQNGFTRIKKLNELATLRLSEAIQNEEFARINAISDRVVSLYNNALNNVEEQAIETETLNHKVRFLGEGITYITTVLFVVIGIYFSYKGSISFSKIVLLLPFQASISNMFSNLTLSINYLSDVIASSKRVDTFLNLSEEIRSHKFTENIQSDNVIEVQSLGHIYNSDIEVLKNITFNLKTGESLALVGGSGSGKSTLIKLIAGLIEPSSGKLSVNGMTSSQETLQTIRTQVAYVQQESPLFNRSIRENIAMGRTTQILSQEDIEKAAKMAEIHDFIMTLPEGYDTIVGDGATSLSGGQRQRIAIARAFISNAPVLIMDEPTASLDHAAQTAIQVVLERLAKERTLIVSAHNLSTIASFSKILVLDKGKIIESGNHESLMNNKKHYYDLWQNLEKE